MRVALVHDWINGMRGGEKCLEAFLDLYPQADIFCLFHEPNRTSSKIDRAVKQTSILQKIPGARRFYRWLLPLYPLAARSLQIKDYDLVISTSHAAAKNVRIQDKAIHICYCFTPMRYIWDQVENYLGRARFIFWPLISYLRLWDQKGSERVDYFVAISSLVAARIRCFYKKRATVIYPGVKTEAAVQVPRESKDKEYFLVAGALVPYKRVDLAILACQELKVPLNIVGTGPQLGALQKLTGNKDTTFLGYLNDQDLLIMYANAKALIFPGKEDFGMVPVEAQASGCPVIAFRSGGATETVVGISPEGQCPIAVKHKTGVFFKEQNTQSLVAAITYFMENESSFSSQACIQNSVRFSPENFSSKWNSFLVSKGLTWATVPVHMTKQFSKEVINA